jgi:hypothetical protein
VRLRLATIALALFVCAGLAACGGSSKHIVHGVSQPFRFFSAASFWNQPLPADARTDPASTRIVAGLNAYVQAELRTGSGPWIDAGTDGVPIATVPASQPTVPVLLNRSDTTNPAMSSAWRAVPLPSNAQPSPGEHDLAVWQPSTDRMWEFFELARVGGAWRARWGGAMQNVSRNFGVYASDAWPGAQPWWGVTASSLPLVGGAMTIRQMQAGNINHALALAVPHTRAGVFASPAQRTDGKSAAPDAIPEGARLRLDPTLSLTSLHLPPLTLAIARAAQRYGIIVRDTGGEVTFFAEEPPNHSHVYADLYRGLTPSQLLSAFPWRHLQLLKMDLHQGA